jgi:hypothetical protein
MGLFRNISRRHASALGRTRVEREMDEELRGFLEASAEDKQRAGMTPEEAARAARVEMGSTNAVKHRIRSAGWETAAKISGRTFATACACWPRARCLRWWPFCRWRWASAPTRPSSA